MTKQLQSKNFSQKKSPYGVAKAQRSLIGYLQVGKPGGITTKGNPIWTTCAVINVDQSSQSKMHSQLPSNAQTALSG